MCVSIFTIIFKGLATQLVTPLNPSNDAKLDHSSGTNDRYANKFAPLDSMTIYPKPGHQLLYTPMTGEIKYPKLYLCLAHFHSNSSNADATHAPT
jgi:hypothetical protein